MTKKNKQINISERSLCCNSKVVVRGKTTMYYVCLKCGEACDVYYTERKVWTRNPKTQILGDKRAKEKNKLTKKEIEEFRKNEDF
jgi:hypothetical protein